MEGNNGPAHAVTVRAPVLYPDGPGVCESSMVIGVTKVTFWGLKA